MSYLVLARKYRPRGFSDIVGQEHVVRTLANAITLDRVHHAFLFTGARGVGKTTTARVLAKALNCAQGPTSQPCGTCVPCTDITQGTSADVLEIDGASNTGVDNVRELRENVKYLPSRGRFKLYIIDEVHMLSQAAFNALLKTLEEPPQHVKFIFATTEPHKIPITILSRCQRFDFRRVSVTVLNEHLQQILQREQVQLSTEARAAVVREAQGSVRDALSLLDQILSYAGDQPTDAQVLEALGAVDRQSVFALCDAVIDKDADALLRRIDLLDSKGHDLGEVANLLVEHWRDVTIAKVAEEPARALAERSPGELDGLQRQAEKLGRTELHRLFDLMVAVAEDVGRSTHTRVTLEMGLLRLMEVEPGESVAKLLEKLDALLAQGGAPNPSGSTGGGPGSEPGAARRPASQAGTELANASRNEAARESHAANGSAAPNDTDTTAAAGETTAEPPSLRDEPGPPPVTAVSSAQTRPAALASSREPEALVAAAPQQPAGASNEPAHANGRGSEATQTNGRGNETTQSNDRGSEATQTNGRGNEATQSNDRGSEATHTNDSGNEATQTNDSGNEPTAVPDAAGASAVRVADGTATATGSVFAEESVGLQPWERLVERVRAMRPAMASVLEHGRPLEFGPTGVRVGYPESSFYLEQARDAEMRELMRHALQEQFGQAVSYSAVAVAESPAAEPLPESMAAAQQRRQREHEEEVRQEALAHPAVRAAMEVLDAEVKEIRPLASHQQKNH